MVAYLNGLNNPVVAVHSLGNMVTSSAICDHGANVNQYYLLNAAVAKEAYGDSAPNDDMVPDRSVIHNQNEGMFSQLGYIGANTRPKHGPANGTNSFRQTMPVRN